MAKASENGEKGYAQGSHCKQLVVADHHIIMVLVGTLRDVTSACANSSDTLSSYPLAGLQVPSTKCQRLCIIEMSLLSVARY